MSLKIQQIKYVLNNKLYERVDDYVRYEYGINIE